MRAFRKAVETSTACRRETFASPGRRAGQAEELAHVLPSAQRNEILVVPSQDLHPARVYLGGPAQERDRRIGAA